MAASMSINSILWRTRLDPPRHVAHPMPRFIVALINQWLESLSSILVIDDSLGRQPRSKSGGGAWWNPWKAVVVVAGVDHDTTCEHETGPIVWRFERIH